MAATNDQITKLEAGLYNPNEEEQIADRRIRRRSVEDTKKALDAAQLSQSIANGTRRRIVRLYAGSDK